MLKLAKFCRIAGIVLAELMVVVGCPAGAAAREGVYWPLWVMLLVLIVAFGLNAWGNWYRKHAEREFDKKYPLWPFEKPIR